MEEEAEDEEDESLWRGFGIYGGPGAFVRLRFVRGPDRPIAVQGGQWRGRQCCDRKKHAGPGWSRWVSFGGPPRRALSQCARASLIVAKASWFIF